MIPSFDIDTLYAAFCESLPEQLQDTGRTLGFRLGLVPQSDIPWSVTFKHDVTLQAPALIAEGMMEIARPDIEKAVLAHMLAVIEAFGTDRIADGQIQDTPELRRVLEVARSFRNQTLLALGGIAGSELAASADRRTLDSIATERRLFTRGRPVSLAAYEAVSGGKQAVGFPASISLARAAGWTHERVQLLESTLMGVWLGLQFQDDVMDWEDDAERGGAWAVLLARHGVRHDDASTSAKDARTLVLSSGTLAQMLELAARRFRAAREGAEALGAYTLAAWAAEREQNALVTRDKEAAHPGYLRRVTQLGPWALEVLG